MRKVYRNNKNVEKKETFASKFKGRRQREFFSVSIRSSFCRHEMAQIVLVFFQNLF